MQNLRLVVIIWSQYVIGCGFGICGQFRIRFDRFGVCREYRVRFERTALFSIIFKDTAGAL